MADDWEDATVRARKVEGGYESIFDLDDEELVVNFVPFDVMAELLAEELGRKPTPEEVDERNREMAGDPKILDALPPFARPGEEGLGEILNNWERVRKFLGMSDLDGKMMELKKQREKEGIIG